MAAHRARVLSIISSLPTIRNSFVHARQTAPALLRCSNFLEPKRPSNYDWRHARLLSTSEAPPPKPIDSIIEARGSELVLSPPALVVTREYEVCFSSESFYQCNEVLTNNFTLIAYLGSGET